MDQTIDVSKLSAESAARLRALCEASAAAARSGGAEAEEEFLLGMAAMLDGFMKHRIETTGEPMPAPIALDDVGGVSTTDMSVDDCLRGARIVSQVADRLGSEGHLPLASFFASTGTELLRIREAKIQIVKNTVVQ